MGVSILKHLDLFSGIGGFALAAQWVWGKDHEIVSFCEIEDFPQKVLKKNFPGAPIHNDIKTLDGSKFGTVDLVSGGFPCQPFSLAGKRRGKEDDRYLWPEMVRIIEESKPRWVIGENVAGFVSMGLEQAVFDLESFGYEVWPFIIPAAAVGAQHQRDRLWIVAHANSTRCQELNLPTQPSRTGFDTRQDIGRRFLSGGGIPSECPVRRKIDGVSHRMDKHRIKALGNAIVPQVAAVIFDNIKTIENEYFDRSRT